METKHLSVSALTKYIKQKMDVDPHLQTVHVKGEISNYSHHSRGHMYLTIKDKNAQIKAVMFAGNNKGLKFQPENGMEVLVTGNISVFEAYGQYQLYIRTMEPDGIGALYLAFEQLKTKLSDAGYFDVVNKQLIPKYPNHICIITSPTGAAVKDILITLKRRYPIVKTTIIPALVQGDLAVNSIVSAIDRANRMQEVDSIILGRGGGSIEDLWAFNDVKVAEAIYKSKKPIITGIGHETDVTISDYISDLRAPTPTGAAELAVPSINELLLNNTQYKERLIRALSQNINFKKTKLKQLEQSYVFRTPKQLFLNKEQLLDRHNERLKSAFKDLLTEKEHSYINAINHLKHYHPQVKIVKSRETIERLTKQNKANLSSNIRYNRNKFSSLLEKLILLNPLSTMNRGFSLAYKEDKSLVKSINDVNINDKISIQLNDGHLLCEINNKRSEKIGE